MNVDFRRLHDASYHHRQLGLLLQNWTAETGLVQQIEEITWRRVILDGTTGRHALKESV
jgi:hypothetical protein